MEHLISSTVFVAGLLVPMLAAWGISCLYTQHARCVCRATHAIYFCVLLLVAGLTIRTIVVNDAAWLVHTLSLSAMVVFGVMRRPAEVDDYGMAITN